MLHVTSDLQVGTLRGPLPMLTACASELSEHDAGGSLDDRMDEKRRPCADFGALCFARHVKRLSCGSSPQC